MRFVLGLTGGIGSGKSAASAWFETQGIVVVDADVGVFVAAVGVGHRGEDEFHQVAVEAGQDHPGMENPAQHPAARHLGRPFDAPGQRLAVLADPAQDVILCQRPRPWRADGGQIVQPAEAVQFGRDRRRHLGGKEIAGQGDAAQMQRAAHDLFAPPCMADGFGFGAVHKPPRCGDAVGHELGSCWKRRNLRSLRAISASA